MAEGQKPSNHDFAPSAPNCPNSDNGPVPTTVSYNTVGHDTVSVMNPQWTSASTTKPVMNQNVHGTFNQAQGSFNNNATIDQIDLECADKASEHNLPMKYGCNNETALYGQPPPAYDDKMVVDAPTVPPPEQPRKLSLPEFVSRQESDDDFKSENFGDQPSDVRSCFLRKVYGLIFLQMVVITAVNVAIFNDAATSLVMMKGLKYILPLGIIIYILTAICVHVCDGPQRRAPGNLVCLAMFTVSLLLMLGLGTASSKGPEMFVALASIIVTLVALMVCAFNNKYAMWSGFALCTVMSLITYGIAFVLGCYAEKSLLFVSLVGALPFGCILVHTTHTIVRDAHRYNVTTRESIFAASVLYVDVWNFFFFKKKILRFT